MRSKLIIILCIFALANTTFTQVKPKKTTKPKPKKTTKPPPKKAKKPPPKKTKKPPPKKTTKPPPKKVPVKCDFATIFSTK